MPTWLKILLISAAVLLVLVVAGAFFTVSRVTSTFGDFDRTTRKAGDDGREFGSAATLEACVGELVRRTAKTDNVAALMVTTPFAWGCLEAAPYDRSFCDGMPASENDSAIRSWAASACRRHGAPDDSELCQLALTPVFGFCSGKRG